MKIRITSCCYTEDIYNGKDQKTLHLTGKAEDRSYHSLTITTGNENNEYAEFIMKEAGYDGGYTSESLKAFNTTPTSELLDTKSWYHLSFSEGRPSRIKKLV